MKTDKLQYHYIRTKKSLAHSLSEIDGESLVYYSSSEKQSEMKISWKERILILLEGQYIGYISNPAQIKTTDYIDPTLAKYIVLLRDLVKVKVENKTLTIHFQQQSQKGKKIDKEWIFRMANQSAAKQWGDLINQQVIDLPSRRSTVALENQEEQILTKKYVTDVLNQQKQIDGILNEAYGKSLINFLIEVAKNKNQQAKNKRILENNVSNTPSYEAVKQSLYPSLESSENQPKVGKRLFDNDENLQHNSKLRTFESLTQAQQEQRRELQKKSKQEKQKYEQEKAKLNGKLQENIKEQRQRLVEENIRKKYESQLFAKKNSQIFEASMIETTQTVQNYSLSQNQMTFMSRVYRILSETPLQEIDQYQGTIKHQQIELKSCSIYQVVYPKGQNITDSTLMKSYRRYVKQIQILYSLISKAGLKSNIVLPMCAFFEKSGIFYIVKSKFHVQKYLNPKTTSSKVKINLMSKKTSQQSIQKAPLDQQQILKKLKQILPQCLLNYELVYQCLKQLEDNKYLLDIPLEKNCLKGLLLPVENKGNYIFYLSEIFITNLESINIKSKKDEELFIKSLQTQIYSNIAQLAQKLDQLDLIICGVKDLRIFMANFGLNMHMLGLVRNKCEYQYTRRIIESQILARTIKIFSKKYLAHQKSKSIRNFLNEIFNKNNIIQTSHDTHTPIWTEINTYIMKNFHLITEIDWHRYYQYDEMKGYLLKSIEHHLGIKMKSQFNLQGAYTDILFRCNGYVNDIQLQQKINKKSVKKDSKIESYFESIRKEIKSKRNKNTIKNHLQQFQLHYGKHHPMIFYLLFQLKQSTQQIKQLISITIKLYGNQHIKLGMVYEYLAQTDSQNQNNYYKKALHIYCMHSEKQSYERVRAKLQNI